MFAKPIGQSFRDVAVICGIFDINRTRAEYIKASINYEIKVFDDFDTMVGETVPDVVIVATVDRYHCEYIIRALDYGCDVITEKPMAISVEDCRAILEAEKRTGKKVIVAFNCRYMPYAARIKELIQEGTAGKILSVDFEYFLDTSHGADYYRRWHRRMIDSGGLLVHKSTHHFDLVNWWLDDEPQEVYANGMLGFYGSNGNQCGERCSKCSCFNTCEFAVNYKNDTFLKEFYFDAEKEGGYFRDGCVFSGDIDIYDSMSVTVRYSRGSLLTYSLIAFSPYEGWRISINGTGGRLEAAEYHSGHRADEPSNYIYFYNRKGEMVTYDIRKSAGSHGGGDEKIQRMLFREDVRDPLGRAADSYEGAMSAMIGICANKSIIEKKPFTIKI